MNKYFKKRITTKNDINLTSNFQHLNSSNGITLMSLIIYITIMFVILALIMRVTIYFTRNINDVADTSFEIEFEKLNMYMLQETNKTGNYVEEISEDRKSITFTDENKLEFVKEDGNETGEIYFNEVKICENVNACVFTATDNLETGKTTITVNLTINEKLKTIQYVINNRLDIAQSTSTEKEYIIEKTNKHGVPIEYQEVEYIESTGTQYINTRVIADNKTGIYIDHTICQNNNTDNILIGSRKDSGNTRFWIDVDWGATDTIGWGYNTYSTTDKRYSISGKESVRVQTTLNYKNDRLSKVNNIEIDNLESRGTLAEQTNSITIFCANYTSQLYYTSCKIYNVKISNEQNDIRDFIPCYRKSDGEIGLYDVVNDEFYTNSGTGTFIKGPNVY